LTRETCTEGTRTRIREDIIGWAMDSSPESQSVFWLTGQAGSGKTTIAYTIAQYFDRLDKGKNPNLHTVFGGSFFCSRQFEETRERIRILPTIVYQLARKSRSYARALHKADKFDSYDKLFEQMEDLLCGPWQESEGERRELPPYLIVIDALDEIEGQEGSAFLADLLKAIDGHYLQGLKFFVTSRPDPDVTELCNSLPPKVVRRLQDVPREDVGSDIDTYLRAKLPNLGKAELDKAAEQADGLFIFAATVVRYLTPRRSITRREQSMLLEKLLSHKSASGAMQPLLIDELYKHILHQAFSDLSDDIFRVRLHILHTFLCTIERTTTSVAAALLSEPDDEIVNAVLSDLHAVLYCKDGQVLWYHASFPDFIFTHERSRFKLDGLEIDISCNEAYQHAFLTKACFDVMLSGNTGLQFNIGEIPSSFIFDDEDQELAARVNTNISAVLKYACHHWATHLTQSGQVAINSDDFCKDISKFLDIYILFWIEAMNLLKASGQCSTMLQHAHKWVLGVSILLFQVFYMSYLILVGQNTNDQLELAASITEAANFAIYFTGNPTAKATPHLYISSLATWSKDSILSQQWRKQFPCIPAFTYLEDSDRPLMTFNSNNLVKCIALSNNGTHIVLGSFTGVIEIWNASSGNNLKLMNGHTNWVNSVAFSSDDTYIVSGSQDNSVRIWDALSGAETKVLNGHGPITSVAFSSDRSYIVSGSLDHSIQIWDASSGAELKILNGHTKPVNSVAFSNNSIYIVSGSSDNSVRVWDALSGAELKVLNGHTKAVNSVAFSYDGTHIVSGSSDNSVQVWDALSGAKLKVLNGHTKTVTSVMFSSDATQIISGSFDKSVRIWNALSGAELKVISHTHAVCSVVLSSDGTHIVSVGSFDDPVYVWDASSRAGPRALNGHTRSVNSVAFSGDGTYIVSGSIDNSMQIWDALSGAEIKVLNGHTKLVNSVAFSSDSSYIVSGSGDHSVRVWDISSGAELKMLNGHTEDVTSVAFSNDDVYIVSGSGDKSIWVWDASSGAPLKVLNGHTKGITSVAFSQDSIYIVSGSKDKSVRIWDASSGVELKLMNGHNGFVLSVAFSNDSTHIISGSRDSVRIWNSLSGAMLKVLTNDIWGISNIKSVAFSSNSTYIVSGSWDNSVHIWDALSGTKLKVLNGHSDAVNSVAFSSDGTYIVSGSKDRSVRVWDASSWVTPKVLSGHTNAITHTISSSSDHATQVSAAEPPFSQWTDWTHTDDNQIITLPSKHCLMWVPPGISLFSPHTLLIMSHFGSASINFEHCKIGPDWASCYVPT